MLLANRVYRAGSKDKAVASSADDARRRPIYKQWSENQMTRALNAVITSGMSVHLAALQFNVPKSTLGDRVSGRVQCGAVSGPTMYLTVAEENKFVKFLSRCSQIGYAQMKF